MLPTDILTHLDIPSINYVLNVLLLNSGSSNALAEFWCFFATVVQFLGGFVLIVLIFVALFLIIVEKAEDEDNLIF